MRTILAFLVVLIISALTTDDSRVFVCVEAVKSFVPVAIVRARVRESLDAYNAASPEPIVSWLIACERGANEGGVAAATSVVALQKSWIDSFYV